jgi:hypothetical protein
MEWFLALNVARDNKHDLVKTNISSFPYQRATKPRKLNKTQKIFKE